MKEEMVNILNRVTSREFVVLIATIVMLAQNIITIAEFLAINGIAVATVNTKKVVEKLK